MRHLVVNADDYGLTPGVSRAILRAHREGVVTSTSVMVVTPSFERTAPWLNGAPALGLGLHCVAVGEDPPLLTAQEIPTLVDRAGRLPRGWRQLIRKAIVGSLDPADVAREFEAQHEAATAAGLRLDHLDTHQHVHLWPSLGNVVVSLARRWGIPFIRVPRSQSRQPFGLGVHFLSDRLTRNLRGRDMRYAPSWYGLDTSGHLDTPALGRLIKVIERDPADLVEIGVHPGEASEPALARYPWGFDWGGELTALTAPDLRSRFDRAGLALTSYTGLSTPAQAP